MGGVTAEKALDGGWGWVVVVSAFMAQFLSWGSPTAVGVLYPEWLATFQEGKGMTAWVGSMVSGIALLTSPICSACVESFGARPVTIFSGVMVAGGMMLSAFAPNISFLIFSYGVVVGLGCGLVYAATLTITCQYFDKRRGLALGIVTTGTSVGGFLYATLQNELISLYGLEGCLLIVGALSLNLMVSAGPMRPLYLPGYYLKQRAALTHHEDGPQDEKKELEKELEKEEKEEKEKEAPMYEKPTTLIVERERASIANDAILTTPGSADKDISAAAAVKELLMAMDTKVVLDYDSEAASGAHRRRAMLCSGRGGVLSCSTVARVVKRHLRPYADYLHETAEFLHERVFGTLCVAIFLFALGAFPPVLFMEDVALSQGLIEDVSDIPLVSIVAITAGAGKLVLGVMADMPWVNSVFLYAATLLGAGAALLLIPVCNSYVGLQVLSAAVGFFSGNWSLSSYITTEIVGLERLSQAHGILMCFGGFGIILGPPVVGWFFDWTQSYDLAFYFSGTCVVLGGVVLLLASLPCWDRKPAKHAANQPASQSEEDAEAEAHLDASVV
ncbi:monocarboxylate transporter 9a [Engraulis encrasicolus]|uniref:monocarboxylate transporter 9a n=1 Tax=Engraulis encrasicolus TaxID=184585 RepID=UPI002FD323C2